MAMLPIQSRKKAGHLQIADARLFSPGIGRRGYEKGPLENPRGHTVSSIAYYNGSDSTAQFRLTPIMTANFLSSHLSNDSHFSSHLWLKGMNLVHFDFMPLLGDDEIRNNNTP